MPVHKQALPARPRRLLVISQVYVPDPAAVGQYLADVAEECTRRGWDVTVYTSARGYDDPRSQYPPDEVRNGVRIRRLLLSSFGKRSILVRLIAQWLFLCQAACRSLVAPKPDVILATTSPPFGGFVAAWVASVRRVPLVWWVMDLNPDQMIAAGKAQPGSWIVRVFDWMNRYTLKRAKAIIALDDFMRDRLLTKEPVAEKALAMPLWPQAVVMNNDPAATAAFRTQHGLIGKFIVMYSGNHSLHNPLGTLLEAATRLEADDRVRFVFIGGGEAKREIDERVVLGARNIVSLPYVPREALPTSLSAADLHVVSIGDAMVGIVHPSKIYSAMATGRPVLSFGPKRCHTAALITASRAGWHVQHGDVDGTFAAIREALTSPTETREAMRGRAVAIMADTFSRERLLGEFCSLLDDLSG